ncbi:MAG TPA: VWA domain-containing protein, partial [Acidobacteriota bacterium]|nr:VWA domain-containing protein [Acidobacteriota bacterium]
MAIDEDLKEMYSRGGTGDSMFEFLENLDNLDRRYIDNADFFCVSDPEKISDDDLYKLLMTEYPNWLREARVKGLLR